MVRFLTKIKNNNTERRSGVDGGVVRCGMSRLHKEGLVAGVLCGARCAAPSDMTLSDWQPVKGNHSRAERAGRSTVTHLHYGAVG